MVIEIIEMFAEKCVFVNSDNLWGVQNMVYLCSRYGTEKSKSQYRFCQEHAG